MLTFDLYAQLPKIKFVGHGIFDLDVRGNAIFWKDSKKNILATLKRARVEYATSDGLKVSGFEENGNSFTYQEWWLKETTE